MYRSSFDLSCADEPSKSEKVAIHFIYMYVYIYIYIYIIHIYILEHNK